MANLGGFKKFFEDAGGSQMRPDEQPYGHGKDGKMDSLDATAMELGVPTSTMGSVPQVGGNVQIGSKIMMGASAIEVLEINPTWVKIKILDDGNKRFIKKPGGLYNDPNPPASSPEIKYVPRAYFTAMTNAGYGGQSGVQAGPAGSPMGGLPPM